MFGFLECIMGVFEKFQLLKTMLNIYNIIEELKS